MMARKSLAAAVLIFVLLMGAGPRKALSRPADGKLRVGIQADALLVIPTGSESDGSTAFSPFLAFEVPLISRLSLRIGLSPPLGSSDGQQAFATNLALNLWFGNGPGFFEAGIGSYYQNTWCNAQDDYKYYTLYLGWRQMKGKTVVRVGGILAVTPQGHLACGIGVGVGRSVLKNAP